MRTVTWQRQIYVVSPANVEHFGVPNNKEQSCASHWISHLAENVSNTSLSICVDMNCSLSWKNKNFLEAVYLSSVYVLLLCVYQRRMCLAASNADVSDIFCIGSSPYTLSRTNPKWSFSPFSLPIILLNQCHLHQAHTF